MAALALRITPRGLELLLKRRLSTTLDGSMMRKGLPRKWSIPGVKHVIMVASGKGGVGKSTTTGTQQAYSLLTHCGYIIYLVNLALGMATVNEVSA